MNGIDLMRELRRQKSIKKLTGKMIRDAENKLSLSYDERIKLDRNIEKFRLASEKIEDLRLMMNKGWTGNLLIKDDLYKI